MNAMTSEYCPDGRGRVSVMIAQVLMTFAVLAAQTAQAAAECEPFQWQEVAAGC